jgi:hypothetical protein
LQVVDGNLSGYFSYFAGSGMRLWQLIIYLFSLALQPSVGYGLLVHKVS